MKDKMYKDVVRTIDPIIEGETDLIPVMSTISYVDVSYTYTDINPEGNDFMDNFTDEAFLAAVIFWEESMNYFLETGVRLPRT